MQWASQSCCHCRCVRIACELWSLSVQIIEAIALQHALLDPHGCLMHVLLRSEVIHMELQFEQMRSTFFYHGTIPYLPHLNYCFLLFEEGYHRPQNRYMPEKKCLEELLLAYLTEGAPKQIVWGINLGIGS